MVPQIKPVGAPNQRCCSLPGHRASTWQAMSRRSVDPSIDELPGAVKGPMPSMSAANWSNSRVLTWLLSNELTHFLQTFATQGVSGALLLEYAKKPDEMDKLFAPGVAEPERPTPTQISALKYAVKNLADKATAATQASVLKRQASELQVQSQIPTTLDGWHKVIRTSSIAHDEQCRRFRFRGSVLTLLVVTLNTIVTSAIFSTISDASQYSWLKAPPAPSLSSAPSSPPFDLPSATRLSQNPTARPGCATPSCGRASMTCMACAGCLTWTRRPANSRSGPIGSRIIKMPSTPHRSLHPQCGTGRQSQRRRRRPHRAAASHEAVQRPQGQFVHHRE